MSATFRICFGVGVHVYIIYQYYQYFFKNKSFRNYSYILLRTNSQLTKNRIIHRSSHNLFCIIFVQFFLGLFINNYINGEHIPTNDI